MTTIVLETKIKAPIEMVFDLSRDIDFHQKSVSQTQETAIAGCTSGTINLGETVTWRGKHFGIWLTHQSKITAMSSPVSFTDIMLKGHFKTFTHEHTFEVIDDYVLMKDVLRFSLPYGILGRLIERTLLRSHLSSFLKIRNKMIKNHLEIEMKTT